MYLFSEIIVSQKKKYLFKKVSKTGNNGYKGACRTRECHAMKLRHIEIFSSNYLCKVCRTKTKKKQFYIICQK